MTSEPLLIQKKSDPSLTDPNFYVYFDEWHGKIISITNKPLSKSDYSMLKTQDHIVKDLMTGIKSIKNYVVAEDYQTQSFKIVERKNYLRLKKEEDFLSKIVETPLSTEQDINIVAYLVDYKLEVNISDELFYSITGVKGNSDVHIDSSHQFEDLKFYITKKNNPNVLYDSIKINPRDLVQQGNIVYDISNLKTKLEIKNIDIYTKRVFKSYGLKIKHNYVKTVPRTVKKRVYTHINSKQFIDQTTFSVSPSTQGWIIRSNFEHAHEYKIYGDLSLFLIGNDPNHLLGKILIPFDKIGNYQEYIVQTQVDPSTCKILVGEQGKNISFKIEDIENV